MFCGNCGYEIKNVAVCNGKCPNCFAPLEPEGMQSFAQETKPVEEKKLTTSFIDEDEQIVAEVGISYLQSYISSATLGKTSAILTNKRAYLSGKCYVKSSGHFVKDEREAVCELEDIVMTGIVRMKRVFLLWTGIIMLCVGLFYLGCAFNSSYDYRIYNEVLVDIQGYGGIIMTIVSIIMLIVYFVTQGIWYEISTAGCTFGISVSKLGGYDKVKEFDGKVHREKAKRIRELKNENTDSEK